MDANFGREITDLVETLKQKAPQFNVWQAAYLCEKIIQRISPSKNENTLDQKGLNFRPYENYVFPPTDIRKFSLNGEQITLVLNFLGLYGINSPIPRCYHEQVAIQQNVYGEGEIPLQNFYDIFNNRFYFLYYNAWKKYRFYLFLGQIPPSKIAKRINSFIGGGYSKEVEEIIPQFALLKFAGLLCTRTKNKSFLQILIRHLFSEYQISIQEFEPVKLEISDIPVLGSSKNLLGINSMIGSSVVDYMSRICLVIGPVSYNEYLDFTPNTFNARKLIELLKLYLNDGIEYNIKFKIKANTIVPISWNDPRQKLGTTIWLGQPKEDYCVVKYTYEEFLSDDK